MFFFRNVELLKVFQKNEHCDRNYEHFIRNNEHFVRNNNFIFEIANGMLGKYNE